LLKAVSFFLAPPPPDDLAAKTSRSLSIRRDQGRENSLFLAGFSEPGFLDTPEGIDVGLIRKELLIRVLFFARVT
jgi:hypothetical protein